MTPAERLAYPVARSSSMVRTACCARAGVRIVVGDFAAAPETRLSKYFVCLITLAVLMASVA